MVSAAHCGERLSGRDAFARDERNEEEVNARATTETSRKFSLRRPAGRIFGAFPVSAMGRMHSRCHSCMHTHLPLHVQGCRMSLLYMRVLELRSSGRRLVGPLYRFAQARNAVYAT
jgi:hypothetical protein